MVSPCFRYSVRDADFESEGLHNVLKTDVFGKIIGLLADEEGDIRQFALNCLNEIVKHSKSVFEIFCLLR